MLSFFIYLYICRPLHINIYIYNQSFNLKKYLLEQKSPFEASDRFLLNCWLILSSFDPFQWTKAFYFSSHQLSENGPTTIKYSSLYNCTYMHTKYDFIMHGVIKSLLSPVWLFLSNHSVFLKLSSSSDREGLWINLFPRPRITFC